MSKGQSLAEFALVLPILMFMLLGFSEAAFLFGTRQGYQNAADVLADVAAQRMAQDPGESWRAHWNPVANEELNRAGCHDADVTLPDGDHESGSRVRVRVRCTYQPHVANVFNGLDVVVQGESVVPFVPKPLPTPQPSAS